MTPPVLFLIFNRPDTTLQVFDAIRKARPPRLYVGADGPRTDRPREAESCDKARRVATSVDWPCEVHTLFRDNNLGCREAVSEAISWFFEHEPEGIIIEDDCLPDPSFFPYCAELLARYRNDERIMSITGNNFQASMGDYPYSYYFSIYFHSWGWASWRRAWRLNDAHLDKYDAFTAAGVLNTLNPTPGFASYWRARFGEVITRKIDTWDYVWLYSCWANSGLTCTPRVNLVTNIGFGPNSTHTNDPHSWQAKLSIEAIESSLSHPRIVCANTPFDTRATHKVYDIPAPVSLGRRLAQKIRKILRRLRSDLSISL